MGNPGIPETVARIMELKAAMTANVGSVVNSSECSNRNFRWSGCCVETPTAQTECCSKPSQPHGQHKQHTHTHTHDTNNTHTYAHTHTRHKQHTHTYAHTHTHTYACTHTHAHTHTHTHTPHTLQQNLEEKPFFGNLVFNTQSSV